MKFCEEVKEKKIEKNENELETDEKFDSKKNKKIMIFSIIGIASFLLIVFLLTGFALININNTKILSGITVNEINLKGLTVEEAKQKLSNYIKNKINKEITFKLENEEFEYLTNLAKLEIDYKIDEAVENAYNIGRDGNIFQNNFNILKTKLKGKDIKINYTYNEELMDGIIKEICEKIPGAVEESSYSVEDDKLIIKVGKEGKTIDKEYVKNEILKKAENDIEDKIILKAIETKPKGIDIDKIHEEIYTEPKDAYYTKDPFQIFPHVNGIDFNVEEAKKILEEPKEEYEIKLIITTPKVTTNQIGTEAFPDLLSTFSTKYDTSNTPRTTNLQLAMKGLDGVIVNPGEVFSYNKTLGERTVAKGYKMAGGYEGGRVVQTLAGGICQISSTLYDAVVYANMDVVERHNHMFLAGYVGAGKDATVVYGSYDFKFKNTRKYPIMIKTSIGNGIAKIDIYGIKEDVEYEVDISTTILSNTPYSVIYENDSSLAPGQQRVSQAGANGCKSVTYKIVKLNGAEVSRTVLSNDTYSPMNKIIKKGPEVVEQPVVEAPEPEPTPTPTVNEPKIQEPEKKQEEKTAEEVVNNTKKETNQI